MCTMGVQQSAFYGSKRPSPRGLNCYDFFEGWELNNFRENQGCFQTKKTVKNSVNFDEKGVKCVQLCVQQQKTPVFFKTKTAHKSLSYKRLSCGAKQDRTADLLNAIQRKIVF